MQRLRSIAGPLWLLVACVALGLAPAISSALHAAEADSSCCHVQGDHGGRAPAPDHDRDDCPICIAIAGLGGLVLLGLDRAGPAPAMDATGWVVHESTRHHVSTPQGGASARGPPRRA